jgi:signal transduction histidine kinase/CheY-like chemotaxis protein
LSGPQPSTIRPDPSASDDADLRSGSVAMQSLDAQAALLRYALILFGIGLPIFVWAASFAPDRIWIIGSFIIFAINWSAFYAVVDWARRRPEQQQNLGLRTRVHIMGGLLWAGAVAQISAVAAGAGTESEPILLLALGAGAICVFFSAPSLPALLIVGPAACAAPLFALFADPDMRPTARAALAAAALGFALSLIFNRLLRRLFAFADERETLIRERAESLAISKRLTKSKSDLIATLSQEIKTGLTGVAHVLASAVGGGRGQPSRDQLAAALDAAEDLISVLNATLDTEIAESGQLSLTRLPFDPAKLVRDVVLLHRPQAAAKGIELTVHVEEHLAQASVGGVVGDAVRTRQILSSLIGNAVKYTLRGRVEVRVECPSLNRLRIEVADTGPGLTADELNRAFDAFTRIERTSTGVSGAGLGLSLASQLAILMGGEVSAESAPGVGSCFWLDLPFDPGARVSRLDGTPMDAGQARPRSLKVLVAEDDALGAAMLRGVLEQLGHHVLLARDGRRAYELAQICEIDLIMLDGRMAEMDGAETIRAIRALDGATGRTPIVAVIEGDGEEARAVIEAGADQVLRKPISVASAARVLAAVGQDTPAMIEALAVA